MKTQLTQQEKRKIASKKYHLANKERIKAERLAKYRESNPLAINTSDLKNMNIRNFKNYPNYFINDLGEVFNKKRLTQIKGAIAPDGYRVVNLCKNGIIKTFNVHQLMREAFFNNKSKKFTVNHIDGVKTNNKLSNLELVTHQANVVHAVKLGLFKGAIKIPVNLFINDLPPMRFACRNQAATYLSKNYINKPIPIIVSGLRHGKLYLSAYRVEKVA